MKNSNYKFYLTSGDSGMILVVPKDGSTSFFMTRQYKFARCVSPSQRDLLIQQLLEFIPTGRNKDFVLPDIINWKYLCSFTQTQDWVNAPGGVHITHGHFFGRVNPYKVIIHTEVGILEPEVIAGSQPVLIGVEGIPAGVRVGSYPDHIPHKAGDQFALDQLINFTPHNVCLQSVLMKPQDLHHRDKGNPVLTYPTLEQMALRIAACKKVFGETKVDEAVSEARKFLKELKFP